MLSPQLSSLPGKERGRYRLPWIILSGVVVLVLLAGGNALLNMRRETDLLRQNLEASETTQTLAILQTIRAPVLAGDWAGVRAQFEGQEAVLVDHHLWLIALDGSMLANSHQAHPEGPAAAANTAPVRSIDPQLHWIRPNQVLRVTLPVSDRQGETLAILINESDQTARFTELYQANLLRMLRLFLALLLILAAISWMNWRLFLWPLNQIYNISNAVKQSGDSAYVPNSPVVEVQRINTAFNEMIDHLTNQRASLAALNHDLEDTVAERTAALEESNAAIRSRADQLEEVNDLLRELVAQSERLNQTSTLEKMIATIGQGAFSLSKADRLAIFVQGADGELQCLWSKNLSAEFIEAAQAYARKEYRSIFGTASFIDQAPLLVSDIQAQKSAFPPWPVSPEDSFRAASAWPLVYENHASAFIGCFYNQPKVWKQNEREILEAFFRQAAAALENTRLFEAECAQRRLSEALRDVTARLTSTLDMDEVLDGIISSLGVVVQHNTAAILLLDGDTIRPVRWRGLPDPSADVSNLWRYPISSLRNRQFMIETVQAIVIPDIAQDPNWVRRPGLEWVRSYAGAPICQRGEVTGFIDLMSAQPGFFSKEIGPILEAFANQAAISLENARLYHNSQQRMAETSALYRAVQPLFSPVEDIEALARQITESVTQEFSSAHCSILLIDESGTYLKLVAQGGPLHLVAPELPLDGPGLTVTAARTRSAIYSPDVQRDPNYVNGSDASHSELAIPLQSGGKIIGVLNLESTEVDAFDERGRRLLESFAEQAALGLENARLFTTVRQNAEQMTRLNEIAQQRAQEAETLRQATAALSSTLNLRSVLDRILNQLEQVVPHDSACMFLVEDEQRLRAWAAKNFEVPVNGQIYPRSNGLFIEIEQRMRPVTLVDAQADPRFEAWGKTTYIRSWMGLPLARGNELVGILTLDRLEIKLFTPEEIELAQAFANQAAIAVHNARLYEAAQQRARELEALHTATTSLVSTLDLQKLLERILASATSAIPNARAAALHLLDEAGQMRLRVQHGLDENEALSPEWNANNNLWNWVLHERQPALVSNSHSIPPNVAGNGLPGRWEGDSLIIAPLLQEDQPLGLITLISPEPHAFIEKDLHLLISFASTATAAIHNAQLHSVVQNLAITDPLTGILNRRGFFDLARRQLELSRQLNRPLSVIMIDIDFFKLVNDQYGHDAGDLVLKTLAGRCRQALRETDLLCRYGGEEFAILLAESEASGTQAAAERLSRSIAETPMETPAGLVSITTSMGVATCCGDCGNLDQLLKRADQALYLAKEAGRNQIRTWSLELSA